MGLFSIFRRRKLEDALSETKRVKIFGVIFHLRKINPLDYVAGAQVMQKHFDTYKTAGQKQQLDLVTANTSKIKDHYVDVFMSSVVEPKLVRKKEDDAKAIWVQNLFTDWDLANALYLKIMEITYGKKKMRSIMSQETALSS